MKIYSPRLCLLGCKVLLDWDNRMYEKTLKNNKKMALFDISQFEQIQGHPPELSDSVKLFLRDAKSHGFKI